MIFGRRIAAERQFARREYIAVEFRDIFLEVTLPAHARNYRLCIPGDI